MVLMKQLNKSTNDLLFFLSALSSSNSTRNFGQEQLQSQEY